MLENSDAKATIPNTHTGILPPKTDTVDKSVEAFKPKSLQDALVVTAKEADAEKSPTIKTQDRQDGHYLLTGRKLALAHTGFLLSAFCAALDQTIVATALPKLASQFNALDELTWVVTAYFLTHAGLMLTFGQILTIAPSKWVYLICIILFEIGSLICAVAPSMTVLIFGRAVQGVGAAGALVSILTIIAQITKLEQRALLFGSFGSVWGIASVVGPLLGGVFTDKVTWRWCFYINLPFGAISIAALIFFVPSHTPAETNLYKNMSTLQKWLALDWVGAVISVGMITCLLLPLQWGGVARSWNDKVIIALFCTFGALLIIFFIWEFYKGKRAMLPLSFFKRRTLVGAGAAMFLLMISFLAATYYLPFFYQAKGRTAAQSGIDVIPFLLSVVVTSFGSGAFVNATGHYWSLMVVGPLVGAVGAGLLFTIDEYTTSARLIGYQLLLGSGLGVAFQQPMMAIQAEYADEPALIPQASSLVTFLQLLGGVVGIAIAGTVFNNQLSTTITQYASSLPPELVRAVQQSVTVIFSLSPELQNQVVHAYVKALDYTFITTVPAAVLMTFAALFIKNWNLKKRSVRTGGV